MERKRQRQQQQQQQQQQPQPQPQPQIHSISCGFCLQLNHVNTHRPRRTQPSRSEPKLLSKTCHDAEVEKQQSLPSGKLT